MIKSWKTTAVGVLGFVMAILGAARCVLDGDPTTNPDWASVIATATVAFGLLFAKDHNVTGGSEPAKPTS